MSSRVGWLSTSALLQCTVLLLLLLLLLAYKELSFIMVGFFFKSNFSFVSLSPTSSPFFLLPWTALPGSFLLSCHLWPFYPLPCLSPSTSAHFPLICMPSVCLWASIKMVHSVLPSETARELCLSSRSQLWQMLGHQGNGMLK